MPAQVRSTGDGSSGPAGLERRGSRRAGRRALARLHPREADGEGRDAWRRRRQEGPDITRNAAGSGRLRRVPERKRFLPPAETIGKPVHSPWLGSARTWAGRRRNAAARLGGETGRRVLAAVRRAVGFGCRVILARDGLRSVLGKAQNAAHAARPELFGRRFGERARAPAAQPPAA